MLTAIVTIIIFLVMISLHEFGHFIVSKLVGVKVHEFAIGMGPAIFKVRGKETLYSLRIFPVGGYCKLEGEDTESEDERAFCNQKWWKRFLVIVAGAVLNILLGFVVLLVMNFSVGEISTPVIDSIIEGSELTEVGVMPGDRIVKINGQRINIYDDIGDVSTELKENEDIDIVVKRNGEKKYVTIKPLKQVMTYYYEEDKVRIVTKTGDGEPSEVIAGYASEEYKKQYVGKTETEERLLLGFMARREKAGFLNTVRHSFYYTGYIVKMVYQGLLDLVTGKAGLEQVSGPVGIVSAVNMTVHSGEDWILNVLFLVALLTVNLGVFNLLPLPALDGGRLFFMIIELIRRKPVPAEKEGMVHAIGLLILLGFAVIISFKDILMLFK